MTKKFIKKSTSTKDNLKEIEDKIKGANNMKKNVIFDTNLSSGNKLREPVCIQYDYYPSTHSDETFEEGYINIFRGTKHIFIARDYDVDNKSTTPRYCIVESDLNTKKQKIYKVEFCEEKNMKNDELLILKLEREMFSNKEEK